MAESCGTDNLEEAERYLAHRLNEIREATIYGIRPTRTFKQAVTKYLNDYQPVGPSCGVVLIWTRDPRRPR